MNDSECSRRFIITQEDEFLQRLTQALLRHHGGQIMESLQTPRTMRHCCTEGCKWGPQLVPYYSERRESLRQLICVVFSLVRQLVRQAKVAFRNPFMRVIHISGVYIYNYIKYMCYIYIHTYMWYVYICGQNWT